MPDRESIKVLFVCSMNQWRSPTAEKIYNDKPFVSARSCGTNANARKTVGSDSLTWADLILVMEQKHRQRLLRQYPGETRYKEIHVLDIPDDYKFMDPELIAEITAAVDPVLSNVLE